MGFAFALLIKNTSHLFGAKINYIFNNDDSSHNSFQKTVNDHLQL